MDPSTIQNTISPMTPDSLKTPPQGAEKPKNHKVTIWALSILSIIATTAAGVFAYLYFTGQNASPAPVVNNNGNTPEPVTEEVEITDTYVLRDLDEKIAILFNTDDTSPTFATGRGISYYDEELFHEGNISQSSKVNSLIKHTIELRPLNEQEIVAALSQSGYADNNEQYFRQNLASGADGDVVAKKYKEIFGKDLTKEDVGSSCGGYRYNKEYDFYYDDVLGCGGTTPYERFYYKNRYTSDDNNAYVYISTAFLGDDSGNVYCDIAYLKSYGIADNAKVCASISENGDFVLDESNYQDFAKYRFIFNKSDDGTYYFEKVEKL